MNRITDPHYPLDRLTREERDYLKGWPRAFSSGYHAGLRIAAEDRTAKARARTGDPGTSHQAASLVKDLRASQREVLDLFITHGPLTDERLVDWAHDDGILQSPSGLRSRRSELVTLGKVEDTGRYDTTHSGRKTIIWRAAE